MGFIVYLQFFHCSITPRSFSLPIIEILYLNYFFKFLLRSDFGVFIYAQLNAIPCLNKKNWDKLFGSANVLVYLLGEKSRNPHVFASFSE